MIFNPGQTGARKCSSAANLSVAGGTSSTLGTRRHVDYVGLFFHRAIQSLAVGRRNRMSVMLHSERVTAHSQRDRCPCRATGNDVMLHSLAGLGAAGWNPNWSSRTAASPATSPRQGWVSAWISTPCNVLSGGDHKTTASDRVAACKKGKHRVTRSVHPDFWRLAEKCGLWRPCRLRLRHEQQQRKAEHHQRDKKRDHHKTHHAAHRNPGNRQHRQSEKRLDHIRDRFTHRHCHRRPRER